MLAGEVFLNLLDGAVPPSRAVRVALTAAPRVTILRIMINKTFAKELGLEVGGRAEVTFGMGESAGTIRLRAHEKGYLLASKPRSRDLLIQVARHPDYISSAASIPSTPMTWDRTDDALLLKLPEEFCVKT